MGTTKRKEKYLLAIDTVSEISSVAVGNCDYLWQGNRKQSNELLPIIDRIMKKNQVDFSQVAGVGVIIGPGSYTGIRIGVSVVNTIAQVGNIPVKSMDSLLAQMLLYLEEKEFKKPNSKSQVSNVMASENNSKRREIISLLSAGYCRVYAKKYVIDQGKIITSADFFHGEISEFLNKEDREIEIVGECNDELMVWLKKNYFLYVFRYTNKTHKSRARVLIDNFEKLLLEKRNIALPKYLK